MKCHKISDGRPPLSPSSCLAVLTVYSIPHLTCQFPGRHSLKGGDPAAGSPTATLLRLHPSRYQALGACFPCGLAQRLRVSAHSHGVTGGVYKARERIHRSLLICDY